MPFKSEKQRKWMHANEPEMADKWARKKKKEAMSASQSKAAHKKFKETGELPPHLKKLVKKIKQLEKDNNVKNIVVPGLEWMSKIKEETKRDYKDEYKKFQSSDKSKKYRAELNQYNRKKGTYGNGDNKDASHKGGKIAGFESQSKNRGRAEKSRLKKEAKTVSIDGEQLMNFLMKRFKYSKKQAIATMKKHKMDTSFLKKESPDFNPMIDTILDDVIDEYQTTNEKVLKKNPGEFVDAKFSKAIDNLPVSKLTKDLVIKLAKKYKVDKDDALRFVSYGYLRDFGLKESVNEGFTKYTIKLTKTPGWYLVHDKNGKQKFEGDRKFVTKHLKKLKTRMGSHQLKSLTQVADKYKGKGVTFDVVESVNEGDKKKYWDLYMKWYKTYEAFARETMNLAKSATKIGTTGKTDERIILKNFKKQVIPFVGLMSSWSKGHENNPHISESVNEGGTGILDKDQTDVLHATVMKNKSKNSKAILSIAMKDRMFKGIDKKELLGYIEGAKQFVKYMSVGRTGNESVNEISGVDLAKKVLKNKSYEKGIDLQTANLIVTIDKAYDKNPALQKKFRAIPLPKMKQLVMKYYG